MPCIFRIVLLVYYIPIFFCCRLKPLASVQTIAVATKAQKVFKLTLSVSRNINPNWFSSLLKHLNQGREMPVKKTLKRQLNWYVNQSLIIIRYCLISGECILISVSSCIFNQAYRIVIVPPVWPFQWLCQSKTFIQISNLIQHFSKLTFDIVPMYSILLKGWRNYAT